MTFAVPKALEDQQPMDFFEDAKLLMFAKHQGAGSMTNTAGPTKNAWEAHW